MILDIIPTNKTVIPKAEDDKIATNDAPFEDGLGGIWQIGAKSLWEYKCKGGIHCNKCPYNDEAGFCNTKYKTAQERDKLIAAAHARFNKMKENSIEDARGGLWRRNEDNPELWSYDCNTMFCATCPNNRGGQPCHVNNLSLEEVKKLVIETKKRLGK